MNPISNLIPFVVICLLQVGDWLSTQLALSVSGVTELNPLVRDLGVWQAKLLVVALVMLLAWRCKKPAKLWFICAIYTAIVASNVALFVTRS